MDGALKITDFDDALNIRQGFYFNVMKELILSNIDNLPNTVLYWSLPQKFLGNKVYYYKASDCFHIMVTQKNEK